MPKIGVATQRRAWRPGGRRLGHPRDRTVREDRRPAEGLAAVGTGPPRAGITPKLSDAELVTLAVMQALLGFTTEARWLRHARARLRDLFPYLPQQPGYNKRLRACARLVVDVIRCWPPTPPCGPMTCGWSTPPRSSAAAPGRRSNAPSWPGGPSTATARRTPALLGPATAPDLHAGGLPVSFALADPKVDERQGCSACSPTSRPDRRPAPPQVLIGDKHYYGGDFEAALGQAKAGVRLLRAARNGEPDRAGAHSFKPLRQPSNRSTRRSKVHSTWNATAGPLRPVSSSVSCNAASR